MPGRLSSAYEFRNPGNDSLCLAFAKRRTEMLGTILIVLLILMLLGSVGTLPTWSHSRSWGYGPSGGLGLVVVILIILLLVRGF
jgi:hypothetical protein